MADKLPFFAAESGTWRTTSPTPHVDLSGTALTLGTYPAQTFKSAADDTTLAFESGDTCTITVWSDATHWARYQGAIWTDAAPDTLDLSVATLVGSAGSLADNDAVSVVAGLPSLIDLAAGVSGILPVANGGTGNTTLVPNLIRGCQVAWSSGTVITIAAGTLAINGGTYTAAGTTTLTSGSTMLDLAGSTVTLGNSKAYWVFALNNDGTLAFRVEYIDGTGDGQDVVWDATLQYYKAATTGANARRIGKFWTTSAGAIPNFLSSKRGSNSAAYTVEALASFMLVSAGTASSFSSIAPTPYVQPSDSFISIGVTAYRTAGTASVATELSLDGGTTYHARIVAYHATTGAMDVTLRPIILPYGGTLYYRASGTSAASYVILLGFEITI